jgi:FKBP-type peptidyl-prolyl cis-trans isomerase
LKEDEEMSALLDQLKNVESSAEAEFPVEAPMIAAAAPVAEMPANLPFSIELLNEGEGEQTVPEGARVTVHYEGRLVNPDGTDGKIFDSSLARHQPYSFTLG